MDQQRKPVVGLIGAPGSGKSWVAAEFARRGARVLSGDQLGHEALRQRGIRNRVIERWGSRIVGEDGEIDRRKLGAIVFADPTERRALETLVHPWIEQRFREEIQEAATHPNVALIVLDAAVLLEAGWDRMCDRVVFVQAPREFRLRRLAEQRSWSEKEVAARENAQMSLADKVRRADFVVDNSGPPEQTAQQVENLLRQWKVI